MSPQQEGAGNKTQTLRQRRVQSTGSKIEVARQSRDTEQSSIRLRMHIEAKARLKNKKSLECNRQWAG